MDAVSTTLYEWRVRKAGELGWRLLAWRMTREEARVWGERHHYEVERVPRTASGRQPPEATPGAV